MSGIFITGTDTGVGKTVITAMLLAWLRDRGVKAAAMKPIACGDGRRDAEIFWTLMGGEVALEMINPVWLKKPLAPLVAARLERKKIDFKEIRASYSALSAQHSALLVEGAGGLMVPISVTSRGRVFAVADIAVGMKLRLLIVAGNRLGVLNHTLATLECAQRRRLKVAGIVLNEFSGERKNLARRTNAEALRETTGLPVIEVPFWGRNFLKKNCGQKKFSVENVAPSQKGQWQCAITAIAEMCGLS